MALSDNKLLNIRVDYESGKLSKTEICKKHRVSHPTLNKHARENDWNFQKNFKEISEIVEKKSLEKLIEQEVDIAAQTNENFKKQVAYIENLAMTYVAQLAKGTKDEAKQTKDEADRIFAFLKSCKISSEIMNMNYNGKRKMLGMDREEELKRSMPKVDPCEGMSEEEVAAKIEELQS